MRSAQPAWSRGFLSLSLRSCFTSQSGTDLALFHPPPSSIGRIPFDRFLPFTRLVYRFVHKMPPPLASQSSCIFATLFAKPLLSPLRVELPIPDFVSTFTDGRPTTKVSPHTAQFWSASPFLAFSLSPICSYFRFWTLALPTFMSTDHFSQFLAPGRIFFQFAPFPRPPHKLDSFRFSTCHFDVIFLGIPLAV